MYKCIDTSFSILLDLYNQFSLWVLIVFYEVAASAELANTESLFLGEIYRYVSHRLQFYILKSVYADRSYFLYFTQEKMGFGSAK